MGIIVVKGKDPQPIAVVDVVIRSSATTPKPDKSDGRKRRAYGSSTGEYNLVDRSILVREPVIRSQGTLILATHGIECGPGVAANHAATIRQLGRYAEVRVGCLKAAPDLAEAFVDAPLPIVIVPLLMSDGYIFDLVQRRLASLPAANLRNLAPPVGQHPALPELLLRSADQVCRSQDWTRSDTSLLLIAHGTPRHRGSARHARDQAQRLAGAGFAAVATSFLEEPPLPEHAVADLPPGPVVAVGLFVDNGPHGDEDVRIALAPVADRVAYTGAVGADPAIISLILAQADSVQGHDGRKSTMEGESGGATSR